MPWWGVVLLVMVPLAGLVVAVAAIERAYVTSFLTDAVSRARRLLSGR